MYLTIEEYLCYGGQIENEATYARLEYKARSYLDTVTLGRTQNLSEISEAIKRCMYELIETYNMENNAEMTGGIGVSSVSNDGVSVTYGSAEAMHNEVRKKCASIVNIYLANELNDKGIPLLYKGVI